MALDTKGLEQPAIATKLHRLSQEKQDLKLSTSDRRITFPL
ncbi:hypothetical protein [Pseudanabaena sp. UWO310]|nr:hypothetical protein [Pseudanabaena sp. UWO310]